MSAEPARRIAPAAAVAAVALAVAAMALFSAHSLTREDQGKQAQYLLDAAMNGHWLAPADMARGELATKPPMYTWLALAASSVLGVGETALRLPAAAASLALALAVFALGKRLGGPAAGLWAALVLVTTLHFGKMAGLARTDGLLACLAAWQFVVAAGAPDLRRPSATRTAALAAICAAACLTKGPAGLVPCLGTLAWLVWTRRTAGIPRAVVVPALAGAAALAAWFLAALRSRGDAVWDTMVDGELVRHATSGAWWNVVYYVPVLATRTLPWALLLPAAAALAWRAVRDARPAPPPDPVALPLSWLAAHLAVFSLLPHKRPDLVFPAEPAVALLVARIACGPPPVRSGRVVSIALAAAAVVVAVARLPADAELPAPPLVRGGVAVVLGGAAWCAFRAGRTGRTALTLAAVAAGGLALSAQNIVGAAPQAEAWSWRAFGDATRADAAAAGGRLFHTAIRHGSPCFHLRIAAGPADDATLAAATRPFVLVAPAAERRRIESVLGQATFLRRHRGEPGSADVALVALRFD